MKNTYFIYKIITFFNFILKNISNMDVCNAENEYFMDYADLEVHRLMLEDEPRTEAYRKAILQNKSYFKDKVVMDVGCGTGILSLFCAQAGAKKVYAVEASNLADLAKEIVEENNYSDIIEVIHSRVEDVVLPKDTKVDVIVSEWMGFYLLHEGMLASVLAARDKFLKKDGEMFPESAIIYIAPCSVPSYNEKWENFSGVSLCSFAKRLRAMKEDKPDIMLISPDDLLAPEIALAWINLKEDSLTDLDSYSMEYIVGASRSGKFEGVCIWFECNFPQLTSEDPVVLSTHPASPSSHWKQTVIHLPQIEEVEEQEPIAFKLDMNKAEESSRRYKLGLTLLDPNEVEHPMPCSCYMTKCILVKTLVDQQTEQVLATADSGIILQEDNIDDEVSD